MLRKYFEEVTKIWSGSDDGSDDLLHYALHASGMTGCGIVSDHAWNTKTHYPLCNENFPFRAHKAICIVRNPLDVANSMFHFWSTQTHTLSLSSK